MTSRAGKKLRGIHWTNHKRKAVEEVRTQPWEPTLGLRPQIRPMPTQQPQQIVLTVLTSIPVGCPWPSPKWYTATPTISHIVQAAVATAVATIATTTTNAVQAVVTTTVTTTATTTVTTTTNTGQAAATTSSTTVQVSVTMPTISTTLHGGGILPNAVAMFTVYSLTTHTATCHNLPHRDTTGLSLFLQFYQRSNDNHDDNHPAMLVRPTTHSSYCPLGTTYNIHAWHYNTHTWYYNTYAWSYTTYHND